MFKGGVVGKRVSTVGRLGATCVSTAETFYLGTYLPTYAKIAINIYIYIYQILIFIIPTTRHVFMQ